LVIRQLFSTNTLLDAKNNSTDDSAATVPQSQG